MNGQEIAFLILAAIGGLAGHLLVTSRNVVHAALYLVVALASVAGVYLLLAAPFVAFVQVIIYVADRGPDPVRHHAHQGPGRPPACSTTPYGPGSGPSWSEPGVFIMFTVFLGGAFGDKRIENQAAAAHRKGKVGDSLLQLRAALRGGVSVLLLAALIGAIVLARRD